VAAIPSGAGGKVQPAHFDVDGLSSDKEPLPYGWEEVNPGGGANTYFFNHLTKLATWTRPDPEPDGLTKPMPVALAVAYEQDSPAPPQNQSPSGAHPPPPLPPPRAPVQESTVLPTDWTELYADDGTPFYHHTPSGSVSWARPPASSSALRGGARLSAAV